MSNIDGYKFSLDEFLSAPADLQFSIQTCPLPTNLRSAVEYLSGFDMSDVRVHYHSPWPEKIQARAFAYGTDIHVGPHQEHTLAHEAWHVVQQKQARAEVEDVWNGMRSGNALETEAHRMGAYLQQLARLFDRMKLIPAGMKPVRAGIAKPLIQRWLQVDGQQYDAASQEDYDAVRKRLDEEHAVNSQTFADLNSMLVSLFKCDMSFRRWDLLAAELKRWRFGYLHCTAAEKLFEDNAAKMGPWMQHNNFDRNKAELVVDKWNKSHTADLRKVALRKSTEPDFLYWNAFTVWKYTHACRLKNSSLYKWLLNEAVAAQRMNCWEFVLYTAGLLLFSGADEADRSKVLMDYVRIALCTGTIQRKYVDANGRFTPAQPEPGPEFIAMMVDNTWYSNHRERNEAGVQAKIPAHIPRGMIIIFSYGAHVAISTGKRVRNKVAPGYGNEMIELERDEPTVARTTIQDRIHGGAHSAYMERIDIGWLPDRLWDNFTLPYTYKTATRAASGKEFNYYQVNTDIYELGDLAI